ncbi:hypothetical protein B0H14DRAFT_2619690 [Mycena olivaceomarginata]|nr:hypothetical protein B0H14DRAFT_2619690 [Mycena olivaceomarginata]
MCTAVSETVLWYWGNRRGKDLVVYSSTPGWQPKKSVGEPCSFWGQVMLRLIYFLVLWCSNLKAQGREHQCGYHVRTQKLYCGIGENKREKDLVLHILLRLCGVPKFKAGNTDVATKFEGIPVRIRVRSSPLYPKLYRGIGENKMEKDLVVYSSTPRSQPKRSARGVLARSLMSICTKIILWYQGTEEGRKDSVVYANTPAMHGRNLKIIT